MMVGVDSNGRYQEVKTNEDGNLEIVMAGEETETTSSASIQTIGTTATSLSINKKVTSIDIANYSETANVTVGIDGSNYVIGANLATTLVINKDVTNISLTSTEDNTTVQIIVKEGKSAGKQKSFPPDWSEIGYEETPSGVIDGFNYAKEIYNNWDSSITSMLNKYMGDKRLVIFPFVDLSNVTNLQGTFNASSLISFPLVNTSNVVNFQGAFRNAPLVSFPQIDTSKATTLNSMFASCVSLQDIPVLNTDSIQGSGLSQIVGGCLELTDESLNNILQICINATGKISTGRQTLRDIGISDTTAYPVSRIQALPNYQAFLDAGWTTGY